MDWFGKSNKGRFESVSLKNINIQQLKPKFDRKKAKNMFGRTRKQVPSVMLPTPEAHARRLGKDMHIPPSESVPPPGKYESVSLDQVKIKDLSSTFESDNPMFSKHENTPEAEEPISSLPTPENFQKKMKFFKNKEQSETLAARDNAGKYRMSMSALFFKSARKWKEKAANTEISFRGNNKSHAMECVNPLFAGSSDIIEETSRISEIPTIPTLNHGVLSDVEEESEAVQSASESIQFCEPEVEDDQSQFSESEAEDDQSHFSESEAEDDQSHFSESEAEDDQSHFSESEAEDDQSHFSESEAEDDQSHFSESEAEDDQSHFSESEAEDDQSHFSESEAEDGHFPDKHDFFDDTTLEFPTAEIPRKKNSLGMRAPSLPPRPRRSQDTTFSLSSIVSDEEL